MRFDPAWEPPRQRTRISPWYQTDPAMGVDMNGAMLWDEARLAGYVTAKTSGLYGDLMGCRYWNASSIDHAQVAM